MKQTLILSIAILLSSCVNDNESGDNFDPYVWDDTTTDEQISSSYFHDFNDISIPFEIKNGVKYIPVRINGGPTFDMIFDTGCSGTLISIKEAQYLYQAGLLSEGDYLGNTKSCIADGSIVENMSFNLRELIIGGKIVCKDVTATVSNNIQAPMLLGNEVFDRAHLITIDNKKQIVTFKVQ